MGWGVSKKRGVTGEASKFLGKPREDWEGNHHPGTLDRILSGQISSRPHTTDFPQMVAFRKGKIPAYSREI